MILKVALWLERWTEDTKIGRENPIYSGYRPSLVIKDSRSDCVVTVLHEDKIEPGKSGNAKIMVLHPDNFGILNEFTKFELREGNRLVATGTITEFLND